MTAFYTQEILEEIRNSNDIVNIVSEYTHMERKGKYLFGLCPFHKEKTASFSVTPSKQIYYCYSCGQGGNVFQFIMNVENLSFQEAVKYLAEKVNIELVEFESEEEKLKLANKKKLFNIHVAAARYYHEQLYIENNISSLKYLNNRDINHKTLKKFGIGYSLKESDSLYKYLKNKGYDEEIILASGLVLTNKKGKRYDRFRDRIMFPIFDVRGNVIGFGGRVLDDAVPKYLNSPESMIYSKGKNLYALNFAKKSEDKRIIIVEGYMDVISLHQRGITNVVASLGTALTDSQAKLLKTYGEEVIIAFDMDSAGQAATMRGLDILDKIGCNVKVLSLPKGKDPDEFIKSYGADAFYKLLDQALMLAEYKIRMLKKQFDTNNIDGKIQFLNKTAFILSKVDNNIEREMYINKISKEYNISEESINSEIMKLSHKKQKNGNNNFKITNTTDRSIKHKKLEGNKIFDMERLLLALLTNDNNIYKVVKKHLDKDFFSCDSNKKIAQNIFERLENNHEVLPADIMNDLELDDVSHFSRIIQEDCNYDDNNKACLDIIKNIKLYKLTNRQQEILDTLKNFNGDNLQAEKLKEELQSIILKIKSINIHNL